MTAGAVVGVASVVSSAVADDNGLTFCDGFLRRVAFEAGESAGGRSSALIGSAGTDAAVADVSEIIATGISAETQYLSPGKPFHSVACGSCFVTGEAGTCIRPGTLEGIRRRASRKPGPSKRGFLDCLPDGCCCCGSGSDECACPLSCASPCADGIGGLCCGAVAVSFTNMACCPQADKGTF